MKLWVIIIIALGLLTSGVAAQNNSNDSSLSKEDTSQLKLYSFPERMPEFQSNLDDYWREHMIIPVSFKGTGKVVATFIVETDGTISHITIRKSLTPDCDNEAIRLIESMPKWKPGFQNYQPVRSLAAAVVINFPPLETKSNKK